MLIMLHKAFGDQFKHHIAFIFTRWSSNRKDV